MITISRKSILTILASVLLCARLHASENFITGIISSSVLSKDGDISEISNARLKLISSATDYAMTGTLELGGQTVDNIFKIWNAYITGQTNYGFLNLGYSKTRFGLEYDYSAYNRVTSRRTFIYRFYEQFYLDSRELQIRFFQPNNFSAYLGFNENGSNRIIGQKSVAMGGGAFYSGWYQIQAGLLEADKAVNYSISQAWWLKSAPFSQELEISGGYGDFYSTAPHFNFIEIDPLRVGPDKKKNEYIIIRDMYFAALKYQADYIQPWTPSFQTRYVIGIQGLQTRILDEDLTNISIFLGLNFEHGPFKIKINAEPVFTLSDVESIDKWEFSNYVIELFYQL